MNTYDHIKYQDLTRRWKEKDIHIGKEFIKDGIIDLERWYKTERKILLLLKEAYGDYGDICYLIRDEWKGPKHKIWWTASYWLYALQKIRGKAVPSFPLLKDQHSECVEYLLSSAVVNIK